MGMNLQELQANLNTCLTAVECTAEHEVIMFAGLTGAGKSTVINQLSGINYERVQDRTTGDHFLQATGDVPPPMSVGHTSISKTLFPQIYIDPETHLAYCDTPGYGENRPGVANVCSSLGIPLVFSKAKAVKAIVTVVDWTSIQPKRGALLSKVLTSIGELFADQDATSMDELVSIEKSVFFVFTKVPYDLEPTQVKECLKEFLEQEVASGRLEFLLAQEKTARQEVHAAPQLTDKYAIEKLQEIRKTIGQLRAKLKMLILLQRNFDHIFLHDERGNNAQMLKLKAVLEAAPALAKDRLVSHFEHPLIEDIAQKALSLIGKRDEQFDAIREDSANLTVLEEKIGACDAEIKRLEQHKLEGALTAAQRVAERDVATQQLQTLNEQQQRAKRSLEQFTRRERVVNEDILNLDTADAVLYCTKELHIKPPVSVDIIGQVMNVVDGALRQFDILPSLRIVMGLFNQSVITSLTSFLREEKHIEYNGMPFVRTEKECMPGTSFNDDEMQLPAEGIYSIGYNPLSGWAKVKIFAEQRQVNREKLSNLRSESDALEQKIVAAGKTTDEIAASILNWTKAIAELEQQERIDCDHLISCFSTEMDTAIQKRDQLEIAQTSKKTSLSAIAAEIAANKDWFEFLLSLSQRIPFNPQSLAAKFVALSTRTSQQLEVTGTTAVNSDSIHQPLLWSAGGAAGLMPPSAPAHVDGEQPRASTVTASSAAVTISRLSTP